MSYSNPEADDAMFDMVLEGEDEERTSEEIEEDDYEAYRGRFAEPEVVPVMLDTDQDDFPF